MWGSRLVDKTLAVTRTDGGDLSLRYGSENLDIRAELVQVFAQMVAAAAEWSDDRG